MVHSPHARVPRSASCPCDRARSGRPWRFLFHRGRYATFILLLGFPLAAGAQTPSTPAASQPGGTTPADESVLDEIQREAAALRPLARTPLGTHFLDAAAELPHVEPMVIYYKKSQRKACSAAEYARLPEAERAAYKEMTLDERYYYTTRYGTPMAYLRALDLLGDAGMGELKGHRVLDFGHGMVGQLRMMATLGAEAVGVEVDSILPLLYGRPGDQGEIVARDGTRGRVRLVNGRFSADPAVVRDVGEGYDLFLSKNTLKRGYIHPERPCDSRMLIDLGVSDDAFLAAVNRALKPGGIVLIYNLCPKAAPPDKPYIPWADGRSPFATQQWERAGFQIMQFDRDDTAAARAMGRALGWDKQGMDVEGDLFAWYTLAQKPMLR